MAARVLVTVCTLAALMALATHVSGWCYVPGLVDDISDQAAVNPCVPWHPAAGTTPLGRPIGETFADNTSVLIWANGTVNSLSTFRGFRLVPYGGVMLGVNYLYPMNLSPRPASIWRHFVLLLHPSCEDVPLNPLNSTNQSPPYFSSAVLIKSWNLTMTAHPDPVAAASGWMYGALPSPLTIVNQTGAHIFGTIFYRHQQYARVKLNFANAGVGTPWFIGSFFEYSGIMYTLFGTSPGQPLYDPATIGRNLSLDVSASVNEFYAATPYIQNVCLLPPRAVFDGSTYFGVILAETRGNLSCKSPSRFQFPYERNDTLYVECFNENVNFAGLGPGNLTVFPRVGTPVPLVCSNCSTVSIPGWNFDASSATFTRNRAACPPGERYPTLTASCDEMDEPATRALIDDEDCRPVVCYPPVVNSTTLVPPGVPANSSLRNEGATVAVTCVLGHRPTDSFPGTTLTSVCQWTELWDPPIRECVPVVCPPYSVANASAINSNCGIGAPTLSTESCNYTCANGLLHIRDLSRTCQANGTWSGRAPICSNVTCGACPQPQNALVTVADPTREGAECVQQCRQGFLPVGNTSATRVCESDGTWSGVAADCRQTCLLSAAENYVIGGGNDEDGQAATVSCASVVQGEIRSGSPCTYACTPCYKGTTQNFNCSEGALIGGPVEPCKIRKCPSPTLVGNGTVVCADGNVTEVRCGTICTAHCAPGWVVADTSSTQNTTVRTCAPAADDGAMDPAETMTCVPCAVETFYVAAPAEGESHCQTCPLGAQCDGGNAAPRAADGWFFDPATGTYVSCAPSAACLGGNRCAPGHSVANLCATCLPGWTKDGSGLCERCNPATVYFVIALIIAMFAMGFLLFKLAKRATAYFASLSVGFNFLQIIAILSSFELKWPSFVLTFMRLFQLFNFDIALFNPRCAVSGGGTSPFVTIFYGRALLPFFSLVMFALVLALVWLYRGISALLEQPDDADTAALSDIARADDETAKARRCLLCFPELGGTAARVVSWRMINAFISFLGLVYLMVTSACVSIYPCTRQPDGRLTMNVEPAIECTSETYFRMRRVSVFVFVVFSCGFPLGTALLLSFFRFDLWRYRTISLFGLLYQRYRPAFYFYECVILLRRFCFVLGRILFPSSPLGHALVALTAVVGSAVAQLALAPYRAPSVNHLELITMGFGITCVAFGIMYVTTAGHMADKTRDGLGGLLVLLICASVCIILFYVVLEIYRQFKLKSHGVGSGYASDRLAIYPEFFALDVHIERNKRVRDEHTTLYSIALRCNEPVELFASLDISDEMVDTDGVPWHVLLSPRASRTLARTSTLTGPVLDSVRVVSAPNGKYHYVSVLLRQPAHYRLFLRAARAGAGGDSVEMSVLGGDAPSACVQALGPASDVLEMFLSSETGCSSRQAFVELTESARELNTRLFMPAQVALRTGRSIDVVLMGTGLSAVVLSPQKPLSAASGFQVPLLADELTAVDSHGANRFAAVFKTALPGRYALWGSTGVTARQSIADSASIATSQSNFVPLAWFDVAAADKLEARLHGDTRRDSLEPGSRGSVDMMTFASFTPDGLDSIDFSRRESAAGLV